MTNGWCCPLVSRDFLSISHSHYMIHLLLPFAFPQSSRCLSHWFALLHLCSTQLFLHTPMSKAQLPHQLLGEHSTFAKMPLLTAHKYQNRHQIKQTNERNIFKTAWNMAEVIFLSSQSSFRVQSNLLSPAWFKSRWNMPGSQPWRLKSSAYLALPREIQASSFAHPEY